MKQHKRTKCICDDFVSGQPIYCGWISENEAENWIKEETEMAKVEERKTYKIYMSFQTWDEEGRWYADTELITTLICKEEEAKVACEMYKADAELWAGNHQCDVEFYFAEYEPPKTETFAEFVSRYEKRKAELIEENELILLEQANEAEFVQYCEIEEAEEEE